MKTLCNKSCRYYFIESRTIEFVFFRFFYDFISILQVHCSMRPGRQDLNVDFFTFRSCPPLDGGGTLPPIRGATGTHFLKISLFDIYFLNFVFFNIKMEKRLATEG